MANPANRLLSYLRAEGFTLAASDGKLLVSPASKLTEELREEIAAAKVDLLKLLAVEAQTPLERFVAGHSPKSMCEVLIELPGGVYRSVPLFSAQELDLVRRALCLWRRCHDGDAPCLAARLLERLEGQRNEEKPCPQP